jgi:hypothetical protein
MRVCDVNDDLVGLDASLVLVSFSCCLNFAARIWKVEPYEPEGDIVPL